jgi:hypothetical protein
MNNAITRWMQFVVKSAWRNFNDATDSLHGLGNDPTYNAESCFETFPFPWLAGEEHKDDPRVQAMAQAAKELGEQRHRWLNAGLTLSPLIIVISFHEVPGWLARQFGI